MINTNKRNMSVERTTYVDSIEIRPTQHLVYIRETTSTSIDGEIVDNYSTKRYIEVGSDISKEDSLVQSIVNNYWSTLS